MPLVAIGSSGYGQKVQDLDVVLLLERVSPMATFGVTGPWAPYRPGW